jgi:hypothetical protein
MSISSNVGVSQFMIRAFQVESQTAIRSLEIASIGALVKVDNFLKLLSKPPHAAARKRLLGPKTSDLPRDHGGVWPQPPPQAQCCTAGSKLHPG